MAIVNEVVEVAKKAAWWKPNIGLLKSLPFIGLLGAAAVTVPFVVSGLRNSRRFDEDNVPMPKSLSDPLPPVLQYTPPEAEPAISMANPVEGDFAKMVKMVRGGMAAGPNIVPPNVLTPSGVSAIDGKHVQDLNNEASTPNFSLPG